ncbi:MAG: hypothetical protein HDQ44_03780 [Desulfovibrio sp.]|nr:hypothetical protein [Desulfovibrio sp.]
MAAATIFTRFLAALGVPHTRSWSDSQFRGMTFKSLYGLAHLLSGYGVKTKAAQFCDKTRLPLLPTPFLAQTKPGAFVIVNMIDPGAKTVAYDSAGEEQKISLSDFENIWNGIALFAAPDEKSREPDYASHKLTEVVAAGSKYLLLAAALTVFSYFFITRGVYSNISTVLLTLFDCLGLYFSWLLLQKSLNIHTKASERVCGVLEQGGCDSIMQLSVSKLFGVFSWSEVGFGYFSVSLAALLIFPHIWPYLALCNVCCLPYTFWSIWYQKFKARHWCTLCVGVQATLWLLFFCYLCGGWLRGALPLHINFIILLAVYVFAVLALNLLLGIFKNLPCHEKNPAA